MVATRLDGKALAKKIQLEIKHNVSEFTGRTLTTPTLAAVLVGDDPASQVYVRNKQRACERAGIRSQLHGLPADSTTEDMIQVVTQLNEDDSIHGILVQLPLPKGVDTQRVLDLIDPRKDVDAFHPINVGFISQERPQFLPCTPHGVLQLLKHYDLTTSGKHVVVIGRSDIVGKPIAMLLASKKSHLGSDYANATVTLCHSRSFDLPAITREADILVAAIGKPEFVTQSMVKPGAVVIDVGINRTDKGLVGDVDFDAVSEVASHITPVPGGIGPLTVTMLLENTLTAAKLQSSRLQNSHS